MNAPQALMAVFDEVMDIPTEEIDVDSGRLRWVDPMTVKDAVLGVLIRLRTLPEHMTEQDRRDAE